METAESSDEAEYNDDGEGRGENGRHERRFLQVAHDDRHNILDILKILQ